MASTFSNLLVVTTGSALVWVWVATAGHAGGPVIMIGPYSGWAFVINCASSYVALLLCYVLLGRQILKRRVAKAILILSSTLASILLVELPAALGWADYAEFLAPKAVGGPGPHNRLPEPEGYFRRPSYDYFRGPRPGESVITLGIATDRRYDVEYRYDRNGFRNQQDFDQETVDMLLIGDSFLEGIHVPYEQLCSTQLGRLLGVDVYNLGQTDYGPVQELAVLHKFGILLHPRAVVWLFFEGNDLFIPDSYGKGPRSTELTARWVDEFRGRSFLRNALAVMGGYLNLVRWRDSDRARKRSARLVSETGRDLTMYFPVEPGGILLHQLRKAQEILLKAKSFCDHNGIQFLLATVPTKFRVYRELLTISPDSELRDWEVNDLPDQLSRWCAEAGIEYLDLTPALRSVSQAGSLVYFVDDLHWTEQGHKVVARELAALIHGEGWLGSVAP